MRTRESVCRVVWSRVSQAAVLACVAASATIAAGQSNERAAFVVNDGNNEGSVTSYLIDEDGSVEFVQKLVTGEGPGFDYGTNATAVSITPNGKFLAIGHASGDPPPGDPPGRRVTIVQVHHDATMSMYMDFLTDPTPNSVQWIDDEYLVVTKSNFSQGSELIMYHVDVDDEVVTEIDRKATGVFMDSIALHPTGDYLFAETTWGDYTLQAFRINADRTLTLKDSVDSSSFVLGLSVTPDGSRVYGGGGISADAVTGFDFDPETGGLSELSNSPYPSPGDGPRQAVISPDGSTLVAGHGGDATIHTYLIDEPTGDLTLTGYTFDAGFQANLRDMQVHEDLLLVPARGVTSSDPQGLATFAFLPDGSLEMKGDFVDSQGINPDGVVGWSPLMCPADLTGDGVVGGADLGTLLASWGTCPDPDECPEDLTGDGAVGGADLGMLLANWGPCP